MINFNEGQIILSEKNILAFSAEELDALAQDGSIAKRKDPVGSYYYVEDEADGMRFGVFIGLGERRVNWLRLHWLDSPVKGWGDVSEKAMKDEYRLLSNLVEKNVGVPPIKGNRKRTWDLTWGQLEVSYEPRTFQVDIFMTPR